MCLPPLMANGVHGVPMHMRHTGPVQTGHDSGSCAQAREVPACPLCTLPMVSQQHSPDHTHAPTHAPTRPLTLGSIRAWSSSRVQQPRIAPPSSEALRCAAGLSLLAVPSSPRLAVPRRCRRGDGASADQKCCPWMCRAAALAVHSPFLSWETTSCCGCGVASWRGGTDELLHMAGSDDASQLRSPNSSSARLHGEAMVGSRGMGECRSKPTSSPSRGHPNERLAAARLAHACSSVCAAVAARWSSRGLTRLNIFGSLVLNGLHVCLRLLWRPWHAPHGSMHVSG